MKFDNKLGIIKKKYFLYKNYFYWSLKKIFFSKKNFRDKKYIKKFYNNSRKKINVHDLNFKEFIFGKSSFYKKKYLLKNNEIYFDNYYKPTLYRYKLISKFIKKNIRHGKYILDIGCGSATLYLARQYPKINFVGIDAAGILFKVSRHTARSYKYGLRQPSTKVAKRIMKVTKGRLDFESIYGSIEEKKSA